MKWLLLFLAVILGVSIAGFLAFYIWMVMPYHSESSSSAFNLTNCYDATEFMTIVSTQASLEPEYQVTSCYAGNGETRIEVIYNQYSFYTQWQVHEGGRLYTRVIDADCQVLALIYGYDSFDEEGNSFDYYVYDLPTGDQLGFGSAKDVLEPDQILNIAGCEGYLPGG